MVDYYKLEFIPIILNKFKVKNVIISGLSDKKTINHVINFCENNDASYIPIDSNFDSNEENVITDSTLDILPALGEFEAIFLNDDPNWYTVYNELNLLNELDQEFPLVFICHNIFPNKRRDSYINPEFIPEEFLNENSKGLVYNDFHFNDNLFHAVEENTPRNGVSTAIEDFIGNNHSISVIDIKLLNGITILCPSSKISIFEELLQVGNVKKLKLSNLSEDYADNQILMDYIYRFNRSNEYDDLINVFKLGFEDKEKIIGNYENKIAVTNEEINLKNLQIDSFNSKLNLKDSQIQNIESKLTNKDAEINNLNNQLENANAEISSLEKDFNKKIEKANSKITSLKDSLDVNEEEFNKKIEKANSKITSLKKDISQKENEESRLNEQLNENKSLLENKDKTIELKEHELSEAEQTLKTVKHQYTNQLSKLDNKEYCISCFKEEITNNHLEIDYLKRNVLLKKVLSPFSYIFILFKSDPKELSLNFKLYKALKNSKCFDIGYYLNKNEDIKDSKWCRYFSPELHFVCNGFKEDRTFNKKYFNRDSKKDLLEYLELCNYE